MLDGPGIERPSSEFACIACYGADGRGGREGGVAMPPITWRHLSTPSASRPAYDMKHFEAALQDGIDPTGRHLHPIMSQYRIDQATLRALQLFLNDIYRRPATGVDAEIIRLATVIPSGDRFREASKAAADVMRAIVENANDTGGIYGRKLVFLVVSDRGELPPDLFALVGRTALPAGNVGTSLDLFPLHQESGPSSPKAAFRLMPSLADQAQLLVENIAAREDPRLGALSYYWCAGTGSLSGPHGAHQYFRARHDRCTHGATNCGGR